MQIDHTILIILQGASMKMTLKLQGFQNKGEKEVKNCWLKKKDQVVLDSQI